MRPYGIKNAVTALFLACVLFHAQAIGASDEVVHPNDVASCVWNLLKIQAEIESPGRSDEYLQYFNMTLPRDKTIEVVGSRKGNFGGKILRIKRFGAAWTSNFATMGYDAQGDPGWIMDALGPKASAVLGFHMIGAHEIECPDRTELLNGLNHLEHQLQAQGVASPVNFIAPQPSKAVLKQYLENFAYRKSLPIEDDRANENHYFHDVGFHLGAKFLPDELVLRARGRVDYHLQFFEYLRQKYESDPLKLSAIKFFQKQLNLDISSGWVDDGTGFMTPWIAAVSSTLKKEGMIGLKTKRHQFEFSFRTTVDTLGGFENYTFFDGYQEIFSKYLAGYGGVHNGRIGSREMSEDQKTSIAAAVKLFPENALQNDLKDFNATFKSKVPGVDANAKWSPDVTHYCDDIFNKMNIVRNAVLSIPHPSD
jgi:hypothetical protein